MLHCFNRSSGHFGSFQHLASQCHAGNRFWSEPKVRACDADEAHYFLVQNCRGQPLARVAAFGSNCRQGERGVLGLFEALPGVSSDVIEDLLGAAAAHLQASGCNSMIGPMNGSSWFDYRFAVPGDGQPFFLDVCNPDEYLGHWLDAGFTPAEHYRTTAFSPGEFAFTRAARFRRRMADSGVVVTGISSDNLLATLPDIHQLCHEAFPANPFFSPLDLATFVGLYEPAIHIIDPRWSLTARDAEGRLLGFAFAFEDLVSESGRNLVIKTVATRRDGSAAGIGAGLTEILHERAHLHRLDRVYHALMHEANPSTRVNCQASSTWREYVLLERTL